MRRAFSSKAKASIRRGFLLGRMAPELFHGGILLTRVYRHVNQHELVLTSHNTGTVGCDGSISWEHSYPEMVSRTKEGMFGLQVRAERIKAAAALM